jgi:hypothetical protein
MTKPISPNEVVSTKTASIPAEVFDGFNEVIGAHWDGHSSTFTQDEVVEVILQKLGDRMTRQELFDRHYLDVEPSYRAAGWHVEYDKPAYCETYAANFTFRKKRTKKS